MGTYHTRALVIGVMCIQQEFVWQQLLHTCMFALPSMVSFSPTTTLKWHSSKERCLSSDWSSETCRGSRAGLDVIMPGTHGWTWAGRVQHVVHSNRNQIILLTDVLYIEACDSQCKRSITTRPSFLSADVHPFVGNIDGNCVIAVTHQLGMVQHVK